MKLRPVTFRYKSDQQGTKQYGLVAEEVEQVYPELVTYGTDGEVETVRYSVLTSMLLNELQKQGREISALKQQTAQLAELNAELARQRKQIAEQQAHSAALAAALAQLRERLDTPRTALWALRQMGH